MSLWLCGLGGVLWSLSLNEPVWGAVPSLGVREFESWLCPVEQVTFFWASVSLSVVAVITVLMTTINLTATIIFLTMHEGAVSINLSYPVSQ